MAKLTKNSTSTKYFSSRQEDYIANLLSGKVQAGSGAPAFCAGDILLDDWLIECKTSMKPKSSFSIKKEWLEKNKEAAFRNRLRNACLCFNFKPNGENYYVIDEKLMKTLMESIYYENSYGIYIR